MENEWKRKIQKPLGVYICTILVLIKFGILNFIGYFLAVQEGNGDVPFLVVIISFGLCLLTAGAAIWALIGDNEGRVALLIILPLNILWLILLAVSALLDNEAANDKPAVLSIVQQVMLSLVVIYIEWYFLSKKVVEYYRQDS